MLGRPLMIEPVFMKAWAGSWLICSVVHRADDADVVGDAGDVREEVGDLLARLPVLAGSRTNGPRAFRTVFCSCASCWPLVNDSGKGWPWSSLELGLVVEGLEVRRAAGHAEVDDALGLDREMRRAHDPAPPLAGLRRVGGVGCTGRRREDRAAAQSEAAQPVGGVSEERAAVESRSATR